MGPMPSEPTLVYMALQCQGLAPVREAGSQPWLSRNRISDMAKRNSQAGSLPSRPATLSIPLPSPWSIASAMQASSRFCTSSRVSRGSKLGFIIVSSPSSLMLRLMAMEISMELWAYRTLCTTKRFRAGRWLIIRTIAATKMVIIVTLGISSLCVRKKSIIGSTSSVSS